MKALITGGNSKFGACLVSELSNTYEVTVIPRDILLQRKFDQYEGEYDLVFFNHHFMPEAFDQMSYHMNCLVCIDIMNVTKDAKLTGWMVSSGIGAKDHPEYAPYFAFKSVNIHIMRYFDHFYDGIYFGVDPGHLIEGHWDTPAKQVVALLDNVESGKIYTLNGSVSGL